MGMTSFLDKTVLVTGGASGIGFLMGKKALERGAKHLVIWDIDEDQLIFAATNLSKLGFSVSTNFVDVSNPDLVSKAATQVLEQHGPIDILFNNAGIVVGKAFHEHSHVDISQTLGINTMGLMFVANAFLPEMMLQNSGNIINITSAAGLTPNPGMAVYAASKWAAVGWSESLRLELKMSNSAVKILNVMPSYINTGMFDGVKTPLMMPLLNPDIIVDKIIRAVERDKSHLKAPFMVKTTMFFRGILPTGVYDFVAGKIFKVYESMDTFKGRENE